MKTTYPDGDVITSANQEWSEAVQSRRITEAAQEPFSGPIPRCVVEPIREYEAQTSALEGLAGVLLIIGLFVAAAALGVFAL
jgi:uncharacterized membrane protein YphA (DoxX/SURF4 family)